MASCGNGEADPDEQCDEGERNGRDEPGACRADCTRPICGDGRSDPGEECDTGDARSDAVSGACRLDCRSAHCGDRVVDGEEQCDEGDTPTDACRRSCQFPRCGDGVQDRGEACDNGVANSDIQPGACRADCTQARCGDGVQDADEACDRGSTNSDYEPNACRAQCVLPRCGDNVIDENEGCDTGVVIDGMAANACRANCVLPRCGDGALDVGEACDDGNQVEGDACRNDCATARCGDLVIDPGETCDDGNRSDGDGCQATCLLPACGDGVLDPGEACDDGNLFDNDGCRSTCQRGCVSGAECADPLFCNGEEQCIDGLCQPGTPPVLDDMVACTSDRCDEDANRILHENTDGACMASASSCELGLRTSHTATCVPALGCEDVPRTEACPDAPSTCTPAAGQDMQLTTFAASCAGGDCGAPLPTAVPCVAPAPTCDPVTRVGIVSRATCDALGETCGSELAERNDCAALDARSCSPDRRTFRSVTGQCTALGACTSELSEQACEARDPSCVDGTRTAFETVCDPQQGCASARALPGERCPARPALCEGSGDTRAHVRYEPACTDATLCDPDGTPIRTDCAGRAPSCIDGAVTTFAPRCEVATGCDAPAIAGTMRCPTPAPTCNPSPDGFVHRRSEASCADALRCSPDGTFIDTPCVAGAPACDGGVLTRFSASCDAATGCGAPVPADRTPCPANPPACNPTPEGYLHIAYAPSCADGGSCAIEGAATLTDCTGNGVTCNAGMLTRTQATCAPLTGCGLPAIVESGACPVSTSSCTEIPGGFLHRQFIPSCDGPGACAPTGMPIEALCITPAAVCADAVITTVAATCDPLTGCGTALGVALPCAAQPSLCEATEEGYRLTRYAPACADGVSCVIGGVPSTQECRGEGTVCANGAVTVSTATCDVTAGCGTSTSGPTPCPVLSSTCTPAGDGYLYATYAPSCLDGSSCVEGGAPLTLNCEGASQICEGGVLRGTVATCDVASGCGTAPAMELPCTAAPPVCELENGLPVHVTYTASCADGKSCAPGGTPQRETCTPPPASCTNGQLTSYEPTCSPEGGCGFVPRTVDCAASPAMCNFAPDGSSVDHVPAMGGCNATATACETGPGPMAQHCALPAASCDAGVQHTYALACAAGVGCSVSDALTPCTARGNECLGDAYYGLSWRRWTPACEGSACASDGLYTDTSCAAGGTACAMEGNAVGTRSTLAACDPATGCGTTPGTFSPCTVDTTTSCDGNARVYFVPRCMDGVCSSERVVENCPGETSVSCDGSTRVTTTPVCRGAGVCDLDVVREACPGTAGTSCDSLGNLVTSAPSCIGAGICGTSMVATPCPGETTRTCVYPSGDLGLLGVSVNGPRCASGICSSAELAFEECTGTSTASCENNHAIERGPDCQLGACTPAVTSDVDCGGGICDDGVCIACNCDDVSTCEGNALVVRKGVCSANGCLGTGAVVSTTPCPLGCANARCNTCNAKNCPMDESCSADGKLVRRPAICTDADVCGLGEPVEAACKEMQVCLKGVCEDLPN